MAKKTFSADVLSAESIEKLKRQLIDYRNGLGRKCRVLVDRLAEMGIAVAEFQVSESPLQHYITLNIERSNSGGNYTAVLVGVGETKTSRDYPEFNTLLAVEFGAGIHFNETPNPKAAEMGYGVGTFPGQVHAFQDEGWFFWNEEKQVWMHSYGVAATMPMYTADMEILRNIEKVAKEIF